MVTVMQGDYWSGFLECFNSLRIEKAILQKLLLLLGLIYTWIQILKISSELIHNEEEPLVTENVESNRMALRSRMENTNAEKVKYEGKSFSRLKRT